MQIRKGYNVVARYSLNIAYYNDYYAAIMIVTPVCRKRKTNVSNCSFLVRTRKATVMTNDDVVCCVHSSPRRFSSWRLFARLAVWNIHVPPIRFAMPEMQDIAITKASAECAIAPIWKTRAIFKETITPFLSTNNLIA